MKGKIKKYLNEFKVTTRGDDTIVVFDEASPELRDAVMNAHGNMLPNDRVFDTFHSILSTLKDYDVESVNELEDLRHEIVDGLVDVYTSDLTQRLNSNINFTHYLDEAKKMDGGNILMAAQYLAIDDIYSSVINLLDGSLEYGI